MSQGTPAPEVLDLEALRRRAERAGISTRFTSFWGEDQTVSPEVLARALAAMGEPADGAPADPIIVAQGQAAEVPLNAEEGWQLLAEENPASVLLEGRGMAVALPATLESGYYLLRTQRGDRLVIVAPRCCWLPQGLQAGEHWWGITAQMYALRSERNWGIGDFTDLCALVRVAAAQGAAFVGVSPLHALRTEHPERASPYSPSSRLALNVLHIDVTAVPEYAQCAAAQALLADNSFQQRLHAVRASATVRYGEVAALKEPMLALLWRDFQDRHWHPRTTRGQAFDDFMAEHQATLGLHARYEAIQLELGARDASVWGWPAWPHELQDPHSPAVQAFVREHAEGVAYRYWLQWLAHTQLTDAFEQARASMALGLYCDLAVGASDGGSETWMWPGLHARGMNVGAPPDPLSTQGQDWGLPPVNPVALSAAHLRPFRQLLASTMRFAGALRMDHAMALMRLYWNGPGGGTYVRYPLEALVAVMAIESHRHQCMVIGEDLGNVAPRMREAMAEHALLSYKPLVFERLEGGAFRPPAEWQPQALAVVSTHDLPTLKGFWGGDDIAIQQALGWLDDMDARVQAQLARAQDRTQLLAALDAQQLLPPGVTLDAQSAPEMTPVLAAAVHAYLARTPCMLLGVQLEDLAGQREQLNVPGTTEDRYPNWRQRLAVPLETLASSPWFNAITQAVEGRRRAAAVTPADALPPLGSADVPVATYRVQLHCDFTFAQATAAVPYLHTLGVSHLYTSPYLKAAAGSTHGYDVVDPTVLNPEIGTDAEHAAMCQALADRGMGHVLDIVPNHMGVEDPANLWWQDMLEHGEASPYAATFDIEWHPANPQTGRRVLLPVLGDHYGKLLEAGELQLRFDATQGRLQVAYWSHVFPLDPRSYAQVLGSVAVPAAAPADERAEVESLVDALAQLPVRDCEDPSQRATRLRDAPLYQRRLAELAQTRPWVQDWVQACVTRVNGQTGAAGPAGADDRYDLLDTVLKAQAYRLADWRVAGDDINYRRFFDINGLAAIRMEDPTVFEAVHALPMRWLAEGKVSGLRIDHPDGLADPARYFERLQQRHVAQRSARGRPPQALYLVVEKIMADHEPLPADWQVHGGTGYRFSTLVNGVLVAADAHAHFDALYKDFTGDIQPFEDAAYECKRLIIESALFSDMAWLVHTLSRITQADRSVCDFTRNQLRVALVEVAAQFPVYRTYVVPDGAPPSEADRQHIAWAVSAARRRLGSAEGGVLAYLQAVLLGETGPEPELRARFVRRWQQFTAPVMAKSIEDTLFYRYVRLVSLNDVGAEPQRFGVSVAAFHQGNLQRARHSPHGLLATSTHDSKRSEDVRARLNVLSEMPDAWHATVQALQAAGQRFEAEVDGRRAPLPRDLWGLYQAMVGIWPAHATRTDERQALAQRIQRYIEKALREAKLVSNWLFPNEAYEAAMRNYVEKVLSTEGFVSVLEGFVQRIAPWGFRNSLVQLALKLMSPGVPDIYQGCETWSFSLVDPDNRRPVDLAAMAESLQPLEALYQSNSRFPEQADWRRVLGDGPAMPHAAKQLVTWRLLQLRRQRATLFRDGLYLPLAVDGPAEAHALAFARIAENDAVVVVCGRLFAGLAASGWGATRVALASAHPVLARADRWRDWLTGEWLEPADALPLSRVLGPVEPGSARLPFAILVAHFEPS
ncbi:malto-oligosyltrehalose synthase [Acidovorax sp.]|uniref:malto-oligosyltrehalose synthase n=1 Tax=Acidovorax sp. TaxID=1872122 RepID=UPI00391BD68D